MSMSLDEPKNPSAPSGTGEILEDDDEAGSCEPEDPSAGPAIPEDVRKKLLDAWKLEE